MLWPAFPGLVELGRGIARATAVAATALGADRIDLATIIEFESGWDPKAINPDPQSTSTGLIQWIAATAFANHMVSSKETARQEIQAMPAGEQLGHVITTLTAAKGKREFPRPMPLRDLYLLVFTPWAAGTPDATVIWEAGSKEAEKNKHLQAPDGSITAGTVSAMIRKQRAKADALPRWDDEASKNNNGDAWDTLFLLSIAGFAAYGLAARK
jgi:hypothetical protein